MKYILIAAIAVMLSGCTGTTTAVNLEGTETTFFGVTFKSDNSTNITIGNKADTNLAMQALKNAQPVILQTETVQTIKKDEQW